jgi:3D-(3,5/4)-trihydroxycyclohexane-1,2-dione acylhydrolase (decyclizing)
VTGARRLTVAQATIEFLAQQVVARDGAERPFFAGVFGIFGHGNVAGIGEALEREMSGPARLPYRPARNEQGMVHAATAFAKRSDRLRAFACTTSIGPGATNLVTGAAAATVNRLPVLLLPGDTFATRRPDPVLQQLERPESRDVSVNDTLRPVSRYWDRVTRPEQLPAALMEAMRVLTSPADTGAVTVCLPQDVQAEAFEPPEGFLERRVHVIPRQRPDGALFARAAELVASSARPLLIAGGGVLYSEATDALRRFVEATGIPLAETQAGKGSLPWDHPQNLGPVGATGGLAANRAARDADLVLCVGTRLTDFTTASKTAFQDPGVRFVSINVAEIDVLKHGALPLLADARAGLEELAAALLEHGYGAGSEYRARYGAWRDEWNAEVDRLRAGGSGGSAGDAGLSQAEVIGVVNDAARPGDVVVCAAGSMPGDLMKLWRTTNPGDYHVEYGYSTMGYEVAGGMGAKLASPDSEVAVMVGDGSWLMLSSELVTSVQEGVKLTVVLVDNHGYGSISSLSRSLGGRSEFNRLRYRDERNGRLDGDFLPIDYVANAASLGAHATAARTREELAAALGEAREAERTSVIVVEVDPDLNPVPGYESWWDVPVAETSGSETVRAARSEYEQQRRRERWFG